MGSPDQEAPWKRDLGLAAGFLLSLVLSPLPDKWRRPVERWLGLNPNDAALASGLVQLFTFLTLWAFGYWAWYHGIDAELNEGTRRLAETGKYDQESYAIIGASALAMSPLLTVIYCFWSPVGFVTMLGTLGGLVRVISAAATGDNCADPTLSIIEWARARLTASGRAKLRVRAKGDASPDRLEVGRIAEDGYDLRLTTSQDLDWRPGNSIVVAGEAFFHLSAQEIRDEAGRLRIRHDLRRLRVGEIVRGPKPYQPTSAPEVVSRA